MESTAAKDGTNHSEGADDDDDDSFARDRGGATIALPSAADHGDIAKDENQTVRRNKCIVYTVLSIAAILFAVFVFVFIRNNEIKAFEKAFYANGPIVFKAIGSSLDRTLIHLDIATTNIISYAKAVNATWPFVTFPDFALVMSKVLPQTDGMIIQLVPIVQPQERDQWEWYTSQNNQWVNDSITLLDNWDEYYYGSINYDWEAHDVIHGDLDDIPRNVSRAMAPQWQVFPVSTQYSYAYNWDWFSMSNPATLYAAMEGRKCVIQYPFLIAEPNNPAADAENKGWVDYYSDFIRPDEEPYEPALEITYPMIDERSTGDDEDVSSSVVGFLSIAIYFREIIRNVLSPGSNGMIIVIENSCSETFTYQIDGPNVTYRGIYDSHDGKYDHLVMTAILTDLLDISTGESVYSGVPIDEELCPYTLRLYPSEDMENTYTSNKAIIFMLVTLCSFAVLTILFIAYDSSVERRQQKVLSSAVRSSTLVSSLFPSSIQEQLYNISVEKERVSQRTASDVENDEIVDAVEKTQGFSGNAIATLYPETTIMFADIKGFTAWSSLRQPDEVFHLLESIYGAFDALARSFGVFKVETIGDTYVAVSGLPQPRKNHAIVMARYAKACIDKMTVVCHRLVQTLGPDTMDLAIRVGLNSGPTTAGVLRGDKARFQLFGDTVNTAARMESNGEINKIQVAESTAIALQQSGKGHWLTLREEEIDVKGKGIMSTYWCDPSNPSSSMSGSSGHLSSNNGCIPDDDTKIGTAPESGSMSSTASRLVSPAVPVFSSSTDSIGQVDSKNDILCEIDPIIEQADGADHHNLDGEPMKEDD